METNICRFYFGMRRILLNMPTILNFIVHEIENATIIIISQRDKIERSNNNCMEYCTEYGTFYYGNIRTRLTDIQITTCFVRNMYLS